MISIPLPGVAQSIIISGRVADQRDSSIAFATVCVSKKGSQDISDKRISDVNGCFHLTIPKPEDYLITISHTSFKDFLKVYRIDATLNLGTIKLIGNNTILDMVTVKAKKNVITRKVDRLVMDVNNNALATGRSALEVFELAPGVFVDKGTISINGNSGTKIMVNNKLLQLSGNDLISYLSSLRSDDIKSFEIISRPPAEYSAEGTGGLINIILKKNSTLGLTGSLGVNYLKGRYSSANENASFNFREKKLSLFLNYAYSKDKDFQDTEFNRFIPSTNVNYWASTNRVNNFNRHRVTTGFIYDLTERQNISFNYTGSFNTGNASYNSLSDIIAPIKTDNNKVVGFYPRDMKTLYNNFGVNYNLELDSIGSNILIVSDYTNNDSRTNSSGQSTFYNENYVVIGDTTFRNYTPSLAHVFTFEGKYLKAFTKATNLNIGLRYTGTNIDNSALFESYEDSNWLSDPNKNYVYDFRENISALFASFNSTISNLDYQLGLRGEYTSTIGNLLTSNITNKRSYFNLFPTLLIKYTLNSRKDSYLTFYYGRRIQRPSYTSLNPYEFYADNYLIGRGNPYLNPSFSNSYEASYVLKNKYSLTFFGDKQSGSISQLLKQSEENSLVTISTWENYGSRFNRGITVYAPFSVADWWKINSNLILRRETQELQQIAFKKNFLSVQIGQLFNLPGQFDLNVNSTYHSGRIAGNIIIGKTLYFDLGLQKQIVHNQLTVKLTMNDVFNRNRMKGVIYYNDYSTGKINQIQQSQRVNLGIIYNFKLGRAFKMKAIEKSNKDEEKRLQ